MIAENKKLLSRNRISGQQFFIANIGGICLVGGDRRVIINEILTYKTK